MKQGFLNKSIAIILWLVFSSSQVLANTKGDNPYIEALPKWQSVLSNYVDEYGRVDFISLSKQPHNLKAFVSAVGSVSPDTHPALFPDRDSVLAYHMNAYNALAMYGVLERNLPKNFSSFFKRASFFRFRKVVIGGETTNLYHYENKVIRPLNEPRTHFVLNCMVKDCPRLMKTAITAENVNDIFEQATKEFLNSDKHVKVLANQERVKVSGILKFYTKDFVASGKANDLIAYINQYRVEKLPESYTVKFLDYNWTVNQSP